MLRYLAFAIWEGALSLWRSRLLNLLSVGTIMFAMFILGSFALVGVNLEAITTQWRDQVQLNVFLRDDIPAEAMERIESRLNKSSMVMEARFISREEARSSFGQDFDTFQDVLGSLSENPFPASFRVSLTAGQEKSAFEALIEDLAALEGVEEVYYDEAIFERLDVLIRLIRIAGLFFGTIMVGSSIFSISNVLKLTFFARREEVDIMKLVGASRAYIRGPFIVEGILIGLSGSLFGVGLVYGAYAITKAYAREVNFLMINFDPVFVDFRIFIFLMAAGAFSGLLGSLVSLRQFLEEHISYQ